MNNMILLLDDDEVFLKVLGRALEKRAYQVLFATNISQALSLAKQSCPAYAVIDLKIDKESGLDCLAALQAINTEIRMLILTGYSSIATAVSAIKSGAVNYACKPLDADEILAALGVGKSSSEGDEESDDFVAEPASIRRIQWEHIQRVLDDNQGNISATARSLGMHRRTLQRRLQKKPVKH